MPVSVGSSSFTCSHRSFPVVKITKYEYLYSSLPSPAIPAPTAQLDTAIAATGGQISAAGANIIAYALNGNPNVDLINPNISPPYWFNSIRINGPGSRPSVILYVLNLKICISSIVCNYISEYISKIFQLFLPLESTKA
jgi:hypothetical protein